MCGSSWWKEVGDSESREIYFYLVLMTPVDDTRAYLNMQPSL